MSVIETPPKDRLAIQTSIVKFSTDVIAAAIRQELARDGPGLLRAQPRGVDLLAGRPGAEAGARGAGGGGPRPDAGSGAREASMLAFVEGRADVLVATTIIENGLDIPRANTHDREPRRPLRPGPALPAARARRPLRPARLRLPAGAARHRALGDRAQAAGRDPRVLRARAPASASPRSTWSCAARATCWAGEQSGHIEAVGLDLYVKLLEQTILELQGGQEPQERPRASLEPPRRPAHPRGVRARGAPAHGRSTSA